MLDVFELLEHRLRRHDHDSALLSQTDSLIGASQIPLMRLFDHLEKLKNGNPIADTRTVVRKEFRQLLYLFKYNTLVKLNATVSDLQANEDTALNDLQMFVSSASQSCCSAYSPFSSMMGESRTKLNELLVATSLQSSKLETQAEYTKRLNAPVVDI